MPTYQPYGPFAIEKTNGQIARDDKKRFWAQVEQECPGLPGAIGCYIFGIRAGRGVLPWYVGMTKEQSFKNESWQDKNLLAMNSALNGRKGTPVLYLIAKRTPVTNAYAKPGKLHTSIAELEELLISFLCGQCVVGGAVLACLCSDRYMLTKAIDEGFYPELLDSAKLLRSMSLICTSTITGTHRRRLVNRSSVRFLSMKTALSNSITRVKKSIKPTFTGSRKCKRFLLLW